MLTTSIGSVSRPGRYESSSRRSCTPCSDAVAVFGSYDLPPRSPNVLSQYRNLFHHFVHQTSNDRATTFWAGCGAVKASAFRAMDGFDAGFKRPLFERA